MTGGKQERSGSRTALEPGDPVPRWRLQRSDGSPFDPYGDADGGRYYLLLTVGDPTRPNAARVLAAFQALASRLDALSVRTFVVQPSGQEVDGLPFEILRDSDGTFFERLDLPLHLGRIPDDSASALALAPNQRVLASWRAGELGRSEAEVMASIETHAERRRSAAPLPLHPPVLMVPDVLSPADCRKLIKIYETEGKEYVEPGHNRLQGRTSDCKMKVPDYGRADRTDHWICTLQGNAFIDSRISRRLLPEIRKAFHYKVTGHERYRIACYEGEGQASRHGHRDNSLPFVAHRRFAVTINLNAEEYEGAELRFAEFGEAAYKTPTGTAIVFSCSLLHEVMAMCEGRRFALLAFLFGES